MLEMMQRCLKLREQLLEFKDAMRQFGFDNEMFPEVLELQRAERRLFEAFSKIEAGDAITDGHA